MEQPNKPTRGDIVRVTPPPFVHPRWERRKALSDEGLSWRVGKYKNLTYVRILKKTGDDKHPYVGTNVPWQWLAVLSPIERLAIEATEEWTNTD